jgi:hypothetical protein
LAKDRLKVCGERIRQRAFTEHHLGVVLLNYLFSGRGPSEDARHLSGPIPRRT